MLLKALAPFEGGINSKALTSSLSGEGSLLKVGSFSFGSPVRASAVSKPIFDIKSTKDNTKISTPILSGPVKNAISFGSLDVSASPKAVVVGLLPITAQADQEVLILDHQQGVVSSHLRH